MLSLGLAFAERILNAYIYDLKPSIHKPLTVQKIRSSFPEVNKLLKVDFTGDEYYNLAWPDVCKQRSYTKVFFPDYVAPKPDKMCSSNMGPIPKWE